MFDGKEVIISYGDIIFKKILQKLINSNENLSTVIDTEWYSYWKKRTQNPLEDAESLKLTRNNYITDIGRKVKVLMKLRVNT